jgi:thiamine biosynthesis protein ThiS
MNTAAAFPVQVNGESKQIPAGTTVRQLLELLNLKPARVAIEHNLEILPKSKWEATHLSQGDRLEIVQFVGGG